MQSNDIIITIMKQEVYNTLLLKAILQLLIKKDVYKNLINEINEEMEKIEFKEKNKDEQ